MMILIFFMVLMTLAIVIPKLMVRFSKVPEDDGVILEHNMKKVRIFDQEYRELWNRLRQAYMEIHDNHYVADHDFMKYHPNHLEILTNKVNLNFDYEYRKRKSQRGYFLNKWSHLDVTIKMEKRNVFLDKILNNGK